ncbi:hypothetical protein L810_0119 [Burkholderia sp. AU4i]|nr:hypothetical protein L810_0119 [Burkholderia sp. AU4i]MDW9246041.1 hypothetical protein [Burkholderia cepacia]QOH35643.1 hypothetical protein C7S14_7818 [Burkholderia cepacia]
MRRQRLNACRWTLDAGTEVVSRAPRHATPDHPPAART